MSFSPLGRNTSCIPQPSGFMMSATSYGTTHQGVGPVPIGHNVVQLVFRAGTNDNPQASTSRRTSNHSRRESRSKGHRGKPEKTTVQVGQEERYVPQYPKYTRVNIFMATEQQIHYHRPQPLCKDQAQQDPTK